MLPILDKFSTEHTLCKTFTNELLTSGFKGDIQHDYATRVSSSIDNSIYQVVPELVLFPKEHTDILKIFTLANSQAFQTLKFSARGAGTGTNGQSLTSGIIIDTSRYMNNILEINLKENYVSVEPGVVLDQLNEVLAPHNVFFAPNLSPSNRATIGGMASTDACGKGSRIYGRTSEHLLELECVLSDGQRVSFEKIDANNLDTLIDKHSRRHSLLSKIYRSVATEVIAQYDKITAQFPKLDRFMTGYNLAKCYDPHKHSVNLNYLISGAEGTLAFITKLKLKLTAIPSHKILFAISYSDFDLALRDAKSLLSLDPAAIETIDDNILKLAKEDEIYPQIRPMLEVHTNHAIAAINLVEFIAHSAEELSTLIKQAKEHLNTQERSFYLATDQDEMTVLWELRKKGVGLLGAMKGAKKPIPFMEDTAVPPENLADYIVELRALLDSYNLRYGMFGHVDVGCLHMRPALDMNDPKDQALVVKLTKEVNDLVKKYGGVYWSEHGKGFRSEYVKDYFGDELHTSLQKIKKAFDPYNKLNPGKIVVPFASNDELVKVNGPFRGNEDAKVDSNTQKLFSGAFDCNGNAACLNYHPDQVMCPSAKVSHNWVYSPKGRTALLREWLKQLTEKSYQPNPFSTAASNKRQNANKNDFSYEVYQSLDKCLGCKACATACPIKVDIPAMKPMFLAEYHKRYKRPLKDYAIKYVEQTAKWQSLIPSLMNAVQSAPFIKTWVNNKLKLVDAPLLSKETLKVGLRKRNAPSFSIEKLKVQQAINPQKTVCIVQDAFTSFYNADVVLAVYDLLTKLGFYVFVLPFYENGKAAHVKGFLTYFHKKAARATDFYNQIARLNVPLIGIDPSMTLVYRDEYRTVLKDQVQFKVELLQEWLVKQLATINITVKEHTTTLSLLAHCSERALAAVSMLHWQKIFKAFGAKLIIEKVGCCGMAGTFGHEKDNLTLSKEIYASSWQKKIDMENLNKQYLATGFSCRCQVKRFSNKQLHHPAVHLLELIN
ncbi:FAD-binding and (Fe-S)-binding domain-containing protein [Cysteiniphilum sp. 6C5]|uniref:FAD-binding and (Fe-S)-binding domain-containing protein n=1 Tax=unclassified Cysteiniphilum TaxID=2610889 RepID=UPI003F82E12D